MKKSPAGTWEKASRRWVRMIDGTRYRVTCKELGLPPESWTREHSERAAKEHFQRLEETRIVERYAPFQNLPAHNAKRKLAEQAEVLETARKDNSEIVSHLRDRMTVIDSQARYLERDAPTALEAKTREDLEFMLGVDLKHVAPEILEHFAVERIRSDAVKPKPKVETDRTLGHLVAVYMRQRATSETNGRAKPSTIEFDRYNLRRLTDYLGESLGIDSIDYDCWHRWSEHCQSYAGRKWAPKTALSTYFASKTFLRWLQKSERLTKLPRNFDDYKVHKVVSEVTVFSLEEIRTIIDAANDEMKMYALLALNTGANQIDLAELGYAKTTKDLGLFGSTIRRKRVKTDRHEGVPMVFYTLWDRTADLVKRYRRKGDNVFLSPTGAKLVDRTRDAKGKHTNSNYLGNAFKRLLTQLGIEGKSYKTLRATSASLLGNKAEFRAFGPLFLGHAPDKIFGKNYLKEDCRELGDAVRWLEGQFFPA